MSLATLRDRTQRNLPAPPPIPPAPIDPTEGRWAVVRMTGEMIVMFAALLALDRWALGGTVFAGISPNPLWLPVLIMAVGYGGGMGLCAAGAASIIWVLAPREAGGGDHLDEVLRLSIEPMLWIVAALAIGEVTTHRRARLVRLQRRAARRDLELNQIAASLDQVGRINRSLQLRIATEERSVGEAIAAALALVEAAPGAQVATLERLIAMALQTGDFAFYLREGGQLVARLRGPDAAVRPEELTCQDLGGSACFQAGARPIGDGTQIAFPVAGDGDEPMAVLVMRAPAGSHLPVAKVAEFSALAAALCPAVAHWQQSHLPLMLPPLRLREHAA